MDRTEQLLFKITGLLTDIRDELRVSNRLIRKEAVQTVAESRTRQKQMRRQMIVESKTGK